MSDERKLRLKTWEENMILKMGQDAFEKMQELTLKRGHRLHSAIGKNQFQNIKNNYMWQIWYFRYGRKPYLKYDK